jgi:hypothetical protein
MKKLGLISFVFLSAIASAQIASKTVTVSTRPIMETTAQIMNRTRLYGPKLPIKVAKSTETEHEVEREHLRQNPRSPASPTWPIHSSDQTIVRTSGKISPPQLFPIAVDFGGPTSSESPYVPPDSNGDVSLSTVVVQANGRIRSFDRLGNAAALNTDADSFFASVRSAAVVDPRVVFDRISKRWIVEAIDVTNPNNRICFAVSDGEKITASTVWSFYQFNQSIGGGSSGFADYVTLGVDANGIYFGSNRFGTFFSNCDVFAVNKASLMGGTLTVTAFHDIIAGSTGIFTPWPCTNDDPAATVAVVIGVDKSTLGQLDYRRITFAGGVFTISANSTLTVPTTAKPFAMPIPISATVTGSVDALDDRLLYARVFRNRLTGEVNIHTAQGIRMDSTGTGAVGGDRDGARWYNVGNAFSGSAILTAAGTVVDSAANPLLCITPSVAMNGQGHEFVGFSMGNSTNSPAIGGAYRLSSDSLVTAPTVIDAGANYYNLQNGTNPKRWGDYSFTMVDPRDMMSIWSFQEYCSANNSWQVRAFKVLAPAPTVASLAPNNANQGQTTDVVVTGTGIFDPDATYPDHLAFTFGSNITVNSVTWNSATQATVNITVGASAATGARTITLTNPDGQTAASSFTVNIGSKTVSGTLTLQSYTGAQLPGTSFVFELRDASTNALIETDAGTVTAGNAFSFSTAQSAGNYKLRIKGINRFLAKSQTIVLGASGVSGLSYTLLNGDANGDNIVGTADFNVLRAAWGGVSPNSPYNVAADFNGDGIIGTTDFNIMRTSWGAVGDN